MGRKKLKSPPFVMVRIDLLKDLEWRNLSSSSKVIYIYLRSKFNRRTFSEVTLAYSEVKDMMSTKTISRAFKELQAKGFIEKKKQGGLYGGVCSYKFVGPYKDFYYKGYTV
jgi:predicted transcriptional regulator